VRAIRPLLALLLAALAALLIPAFAGAKPSGGEAEASEAVAPQPPGTGERILSFLSDVVVGADGTLTVTETIRVRAEGNQIQRGIFRDFPTRYERDGRRIRVGFDVDGVERDGRTEPWTTESIDNGERLRIGDANVMLAQGEHVYVIRYRTTRQLGFFDSYDELYWNATGNGWMFPIDVAEARIRLPQAVPFGSRATYTGPQGATTSNAEVVEEAPGNILFRTTAGLNPYEGLTVAVAWPKGVVEAPPPPSAFALWLERFAPISAAILAVLAICGFYYQAWRVAGRGPIAGPVVPTFAPPEGMTAPAIGYVRDMGFDNRVFAAAIVESGVKGKLRLVEEDGGIFSGDKTRIEKTGDFADLAKPEGDMLEALFREGDTVEADKSNHRLFGAARTALEGELQSLYLGKLFLANQGWAWGGLLVILAAMLLVGIVAGATDTLAEPGAMSVPVIGLVLLVAALFVGRRSRLAIKGGSILLAILAIVIGIGGGLLMLLSLVLALASPGALWMLAPLITLPLAFTAFKWMSAPTREGRVVMDQIAGFELYLSVTEEDRFETLHPPEKTPELFERYLPHAIALGVENRWADNFSSVLAAAAAAPDQRNAGMGWYVGSHNAWSNPGRFATAVGATLASTVAAASTAPGSSSGSGGGGSSGGGGGGGGGGGW
jgi:hypothetical protein